MNVSVVVATYGGREWAARAIEHAVPSVETEQPFELVVRHYDDLTLAGARNMAAEQATGDWLCFVDADDQLEPGYLDAMRMAYQVLYADVVAGLWRPPLLVPSLRLGDAVAGIPAWDASLIDLNCAVIGTLIHRDVFWLAGGFREWPIYEDWALWLACVLVGAKMLPVRAAVYAATVRGGSRNTPTVDARRVYDEIRASHANVDPQVWADAKLRA